MSRAICICNLLETKGTVKGNGFKEEESSNAADNIKKKNRKLLGISAKKDGWILRNSAHSIYKTVLAYQLIVSILILPTKRQKTIKVWQTIHLSDILTHFFCCWCHQPFRLGLVALAWWPDMSWRNVLIMAWMVILQQRNDYKWQSISTAPSPVANRVSHDRTRAQPNESATRFAYRNLNWKFQLSRRVVLRHKRREKKKKTKAKICE